ncbi:MAG: response regulator transcription factor [Erysipelotrichaceae bacterium]
MKVIIADDEYRICSLLNNLINWKDLDLECSGIYQNAFDVLEHLQKETVDILICDIEMPGMTGLELIEKISRMHPFVNIIIVSGYRNFEYAQKALKFGVQRYILKPIDEAELNDTLKEIISSSVEVQKNIRSQRSFLIKDMSDGIILNDIVAINKKYNYSFRDGCFRVLKIMVPVKKNSISTSNKIKNVILSYLLSGLSMICYEYEFFDVSENISYAILNYEDNDKSNAIDELLFNSINKASSISSEKVFISVGVPFYDISFLMSSLDSAETVSWDRFGKSVSQVLFAKTVVEEIPNEELILSFEEKNIFSKIIEVSDYNEIKKWIKNSFSERSILLKKFPKANYILSISILVLLNNTFYNLGHKQSFNISSQKEYDIILKNSMNEEELIENLFSIIKKEITTYFKTNIILTNDYIQQAINYISKHYKEEISLQDVANKLGLNYNYVCALFKDEVGVNFKKYITQLRIDESKRQLIDTNKTISQIAANVGYRNAFYFTSIFVEYTGLKPKDYRKLHRIMR